MLAARVHFLFLLLTRWCSSGVWNSRADKPPSRLVAAAFSLNGVVRTLPSDTLSFCVFVWWVLMGKSPSDQCWCDIFLYWVCIVPLGAAWDTESPCPSPKLPRLLPVCDLLVFLFACFVFVCLFVFCGKLLLSWCWYFFNCNFYKTKLQPLFWILPNTTWFLPANVWVFTLKKRKEQNKNRKNFFCSLVISGLTFKCFKVLLCLFILFSLCAELTRTGPTLQKAYQDMIVSSSNEKPSYLENTTHCIPKTQPPHWVRQCCVVVIKV